VETLEVLGGALVRGERVLQIGGLELAAAAGTAAAAHTTTTHEAPPPSAWHDVIIRLLVRGARAALLPMYSGLMRAVRTAHVRRVAVGGATAALIAAAACGTGRQAQWESRPPAAAGTAAAAAAAGTATPSGAGDDAAAEAAWAQRGDRAQLEAAIAAWERVAAASAGNDAAAPATAQTWAKLARAYYFLADGHLRKQGTTSPAYLDAFEKGTAAGERGLAAANAEFKRRVVAGDKVEDAIKVAGSESLGAMYWYAANLGKWSRAKGFATTLGNKDRVKGVMTRALELDAAFFHGGPHRYFGAFYAVAPSFAGGDLDKSREHFEKSIALAPGYAGTKILMAETYAAKKQDAALFDRLIAEVLAMPDTAIPGLEPETRVEKEKALELKAKRDEIF
jgi:hypothetical protein